MARALISRSTQLTVAVLPVLCRFLTRPRLLTRIAPPPQSADCLNVQQPVTHDTTRGLAARERARVSGVSRTIGSDNDAQTFDSTSEAPGPGLH
jgi:hypothetical protein